jgi:endonuclease/exonuclease/phosphatase (EEP) superfamily protein YafD
MIRNDNWVFRAMEYPRLQKWVLVAATLLLWFAFGLQPPSVTSLAAMGLLFFSLIYLSYQIYPYLPIAPNELRAFGNNRQSNNQLSILVSNVYQPNRETARLKEVINILNPDIILLVETDQYWESEMNYLDEKYPHQVKEPKDNTYGMFLYSRLPLSDVEIRYMVEEDIPSIHAWVHLPSRKKIRLFGLHPRPPVPTENPRSTEKDAELILVAREVAETDAPVIVAGDLNDVAWSYTTSLFQRLSGLLDPRKGRGFFNTFNAKNPLMRIPLDHVFVSSHFKLRNMSRVRSVGSDHFPIFISLECSEHFQYQQQTPEAVEADEKVADEKLLKLQSS